MGTFLLRNFVSGDFVDGAHLELYQEACLFGYCLDSLHEILLHLLRMVVFDEDIYPGAH
jgi:hypothetical protein